MEDGLKGSKSTGNQVVEGWRWSVKKTRHIIRFLQFRTDRVEFWSGVRNFFLVFWEL
jgi:hypothetical protein